jgi:pimeloyl-ACP methyl ester carboxylesterase
MRKFASFFSWSFALLAAIVLFNVFRYLIFWSPTEEITFNSGDIELSGLLVKPEDEGRYPAVVILHGSGPESYADPAYKITAATLVRSGFAVLLYDKRGVRNSGGDFDSALYVDFVDDAVAAVEYLETRIDIDINHIGLFGNSESGWLTPEIAFRSGNIAFIFNRVGPPLPWIDTVLWEVRNEFLDAGIAETDIDKLLDITERRWRFMQAVGFDSSVARGPEWDEINAELQLLRESIPLADEVLPEELHPYERRYYRNFALDSSYDPGPFLEKIDVPMYYAFGENDLNVPTVECVEYLEKLRNEHGKNISYTVFEGLGHSLAHWSGILTGGYFPEYIDIVVTWTTEQLH